MTNANAAGQVIFLPLLMAVIVSSGWRSALMVMMAASVILIPAIFLWMRDNPADIGLEPYGSVKGGVYRQRRGTYANRDFHPIPASSVSEVFQSSTFWLLSGCFFVCGVTANGLIGTHLIPHAIERGIPQVTAAAAVGIMGGAELRRDDIRGMADRPGRPAESPLGSLCSSGIVAFHFAVCVRAIGSVCVRRHVRSRLVRDRTRDNGDPRA